MFQFPENHSLKSKERPTQSSVNACRIFRIIQMPESVASEFSEKMKAPPENREPPANKVRQAPIGGGSTEDPKSTRDLIQVRRFLSLRAPFLARR